MFSKFFQRICASPPNLTFLCLLSCALLLAPLSTPAYAQDPAPMSIVMAQRDQAYREALTFDFRKANRDQQKAIIEKVDKFNLLADLAAPLSEMLVDPKVDGWVKLQLLTKLRNTIPPKLTPELQPYISAIYHQLTHRKWGNAYEENFAIAAVTLEALADQNPQQLEELESLIQDALASVDLPWETKLRCLVALENVKSKLTSRLRPQWKDYDQFASGQTSLDAYLATNPPQWQLVYALRDRMFYIGTAGTQRLIQFLDTPAGKECRPHLMRPVDIGAIKTSDEFDLWLAYAQRTDLDFAPSIWNLLARSAPRLIIKSRYNAVKQTITYLESGKDPKGESSYLALCLLYSLGPLSDVAGSRVEAFLDKGNALYKGKNPLYIDLMRRSALTALEGHPLKASSWKYLHQAVKQRPQDYGDEHHLFVLLSQPPACKADFKNDMLALLSRPQSSPNTVLSRRARDGKIQFIPRSWVAIETLLTSKSFAPTPEQTTLIKSFRTDQMPKDLLTQIDQLK